MTTPNLRGARLRVELDLRPFAHVRQLYNHAGISLAHRTALHADGIDAVAAQIRSCFVVLEQMAHPLVLGMRLIAKLARLQQCDLESGIAEQVNDLARSILAGMASFHFRVGLGGPNVRRERIRDDNPAESPRSRAASRCSEL